jgi:hypothetical protein
MTLKQMGWVLVLLFVVGTRVYAGDDALSQPQTVTAGERVAAYLQSLMISTGAIIESKNQGDLINRPEVYRIAVTYDLQDKVLDVSVVGTEGDIEAAKKKLKIAQEMIMNFNKKIQRNFGITLTKDDLVMDYLDAKAGKIILKYRNGNFEIPDDESTEKAQEPKATPTQVQPTPTQTPTKP